MERKSVLFLPLAPIGSSVVFANMGKLIYSLLLAYIL